MSVATIPPAAAVYREEQFFAWWVYALLAATMVLTWVPMVWPHPADPAAAAPALPVDGPLRIALGVLLPTVLILGLLRMTTLVTPTDVRVWFGYVPTYRREIALHAIQGLEVVRYRPLADYWGWGIRRGPDGELALCARGDRGVRLYLTDGSKLLIGSQDPEALAGAIERALRPVV